MRHHKLLVSLFCLGQILSLSAKRISGSLLSDEDRNPVKGAYISIFKADSIVATGQSDNKGRFNLDVAEAGALTAVTTALGYADSELTFLADTVTLPLSIILREATLSKALDEVTVTADKSRIVTRTANGEIFYLSDRAKRESNPFMALTEIPLIISDFSTSSIKMLDGKQPLVLIDGMSVNSGISPILPADIESVEVITTVPARYLQEGYSGLVNIKLRKNRAPYVWFGASMWQNIPTATASGPGLNFEVGNEKFSIYGAGVYFYARDFKSKDIVSRVNSGYTQQFTSLTNGSSDNWIGRLFMKYRPSENDYLALSIGDTDDDSHTRTSAEGEYTAAETVRYLSEGTNKNRSNVGSAALYYRHDFPRNDGIELTATFNTNINKLNTRTIETFGSESGEFRSVYHNNRKSAAVKADYSRWFSNGSSLALGNHVTMNFDKIDQRIPENPLFRHNKVNEYLYGSYSGRWSKLRYNLSAGIEAIWLKAGDKRNDYLRPRGSATATWVYNPRNSTRISYTLSNETPSIAMLNPYDTSTDPLVVSSGNPLLKPKTRHSGFIQHTFNKSGWYISPAVGGLYDRDLITPWGFSDGDIYHATYRNSGHYSEITYDLNVSYNAPWVSMTLYNGWTDQYFRGQRAKGFFETQTNLFFRAKKVYFIVEMNYKTRSFTENSSTRYRSPLSCRLHVSYNFSPDFYIATGIQNFCGSRKSVAEINQDAFHSVTESINNGEGRGFTPYISIYYNFRKNAKRQIKFNNPNLQEETGIKLR